MAIWPKNNIRWEAETHVVCTSRARRPVQQHQYHQYHQYLGVFAKHFGVEADPVVGYKQASLVEDVFLQSTGVT